MNGLIDSDTYFERRSKKYKDCTIINGEFRALDEYRRVEIMRNYCLDLKGDKWHECAIDHFQDKSGYNFVSSVCSSLPFLWGC